MEIKMKRPTIISQIIRSHLRFVFLVAIVLSATLFFVTRARALSTINVTDYSGGTNGGNSCDFYNVSGSAFNDDPAVDFVVLVENLTQNTSSTTVLNNMAINYTGNCIACGGSPPIPGTLITDTIRFTFSWRNDALVTLASATITVTCGSTVTFGGASSPPSSPAAPPWNPHVWPYDDDSAFMDYLKSATFNGNHACGYFNLASANGKGWGPKVVYVPRFSDCMPYVGNLTVACWDGENLAWRQDTVTDLKVTEGGYKLEFFSKQDGICGLFPK